MKNNTTSSLEPINPYAFIFAVERREDLTPDQALDYDIFMYEAAGNAQAANELKLQRIEQVKCYERANRET